MTEGYYTETYITEWKDKDNVIISMWHQNELDDTEQVGVVELAVYKRGEHKDEALVWNLHVNEDHRRKGLARQLMDEAHKTAKHLGAKVTALEWSLKESPYWVIEWYYRLGYDEKEFGDGYALMKRPTIEVINVKILHLVLKKKWYEMQERGEKTEEYREITPYWVKRLVWDEDYDEPVSDEDVEFICSRPKGVKNIFDVGWKPKPYTHVCFHYGYTQRCFINRIDSITIGRGCPEWGAPEDRDVFIIKHHREPSPFVVGKADGKPETQNR